MLRRREGAPRPDDRIDNELVESVEAGLPWAVLLSSADCPPEEAEGRLLRLVLTGYLEGEMGESPKRTEEPPRALQEVVISAAPPRPGQVRARGTIPPGVKAILRRADATPSEPVRNVVREERATPQRAHAGSFPPPGSSVRPNPSMRPNPSGVLPRTSARPASATPSLPPAGSPQSCVVDSPLGALIDEFSRGAGMKKWCAARMREALEEELAGNLVQAISIIQLVMTRDSDPRIHKERDRIQAQSLQTTSGIFRAQAIAAQRKQRTGEAADNWAKVAETAPDDVEAIMNAAKAAWRARDPKRAAQFARRVVQLDPGHVAAHKLLQVFFELQGMDKSAERERDILRRLKQA